jgi:hypothetical protein
MDLRIPWEMVSTWDLEVKGLTYPETDLGPVVGIHGKLLSRPIFVALEGCCDLGVLLFKHIARHVSGRLRSLGSSSLFLHSRHLDDFDFARAHGVKELLVVLGL